MAKRPRENDATRDRSIALHISFRRSIFPAARVPVTFIGHPLATRVRPALSRGEFFRKHNLPEGRPLVAVLPGSRRSEALRHLPELVRAAAEILTEKRRRLTHAPASPTCGAEFFAAPLAGSPIRAIEERHGTRWRMRRRARGERNGDRGSGLLGAPMVTFYRVTGISWAIGRLLVDVPFYSMVNLIAGKKGFRS